MLHITSDEVKKVLLSSILVILTGILITIISLLPGMVRYDQAEDAKSKYLNGQYTSKLIGDIFVSDNGDMYVYIPTADKVYRVEK